MTDLYHLALFVHIGGVALLFVAIGAEALAVWGVGRAQTASEARLWLRSAHGPEKLFPLGGALILIAGLYMAITVWQGTPWVVVGLIGLIAFSVGGAVINGGRLKALEQAASAGDGAISDALRRERANPTLRISLWTMSVAAVGIVYMMVAKPDWIGSIAALVIAVLIGAVAGLLAGQHGGAALAPAQVSEDRAATR